MTPGQAALLRKARRNLKADYDEEEIPTREDAEDQIAHATEFLRVAEQSIGRPESP